jgi:ribonuclease Z
MKADSLRRHEWSVVALGTGGPGSDTRRGYPSLLLRVGTHRILIDAGDGTLSQLSKWDTARRLDVIVITSITTERIGGLPTILDHPVLRGKRHAPLLIGPSGISDVLRRMAYFMSAEARVRDVIEADDETTLSIHEADLSVAVVDVGPTGPSLGLRLSEPDAPGRFNVEAARRLGLTPGPAFSELQRGLTVGDVQPHEVIGPPRLGRKLAVLGPCRPTARAAVQAQNARMLLAVTPYIEERQEIAVEAHVMTGVEAAIFATQAQAETLGLLHVGALSRVGYARREAAQFHKRVVLVDDGDDFNVPLPDNGTVDHRQAAARAPSGRVPAKSSR